MLYTFLIITILLIAGAIVLGRFLKSVQPTGFEVEEDLIELRQQLERFKGGLAPWSAGISTNEMDQIIETSKSRTGSGVYLSSLGEPVMAYAFKNYIGPGKNAVFVIFTHQQEYIYRVTNKGTEISINGTKAGLIRENGTFYDLRNKAKASLKNTFEANSDKIFIGDLEVASIALPGSGKIEVVDITGEENQLPAESKQLIKTLTIHRLMDNI